MPTHKKAESDRVTVLVMGQSGPDSLALRFLLHVFYFKLLLAISGRIARLEILTDGLAIQRAGYAIGFRAGRIFESSDFETFIGHGI